MTEIVIVLRLEVPDGVTIANPPALTVVPDHIDEPTPIRTRPAKPSRRQAAPPGPRIGPLQRQILEVLAQRLDGAITDGSGRATARLHDRLNTESSFDTTGTSVARLDELGLVDRQIRGRRCYRIRLTDAGWDASGRQRPTAPSVPDLRPGGVVRRPGMPMCGPIERRPFDPEQVRAEQAHAGEDAGL